MSLVGGAMCMEPHLCCWLVTLCVWSRIYVVGWWRYLYGAASMLLVGDIMCMELHLSLVGGAMCMEKDLFVVSL